MSDSLESPWILEATADNFAALVLDNSARGPVLVNFWSPSVEPCLRLYPLLDKLVHEFSGRMLASVLLMSDDYEAAMEQLLEIMRRDRHFRDDAGRDGLVAIFRILGNRGPLVERFRIFELINQ